MIYKLITLDIVDDNFKSALFLYYVLYLGLTYIVVWFYSLDFNTYGR